MLGDDNFLYLKIPRAMGGALVKGLVQATISCKHDSRSSPERIEATQYILLQFANELLNPDKLNSEGAAVLNTVFEATPEGHDAAE